MDCTSVIGLVLAAGKGTRMKSDQPKVLHEVFFAPMIHHVVGTLQSVFLGKIVVVTFPNTPNEDKNFLKEYVKNRPNSNYFETIDIFSDKKLYFLNDYHPTKEGHEAIADDIYSYIISNNIISCN